MPSTLTRLFTFAKATGSQPIENFTTEALAAAIRKDPKPLVTALGDAGVVARLGVKEGSPVVETQVRVPGGIVDLVVELTLDTGPLVLWIEIKAHAGLHGDQLGTYLAAADGRGTTPKPLVIMLCKRPLTDAVPTLRWNSIRGAIDEQVHLVHDYWCDLRDFLEEHGMADDFDTPITPAELAVAAAAHSLLRKCARLAHEFLASLPDGEWKDGEFPTSEGRVVDTMANQFRRHKRLVTSSKRYPWVNFGLTFVAGPKLEVWIEFRPTDFEARDAVFAAARRGGLSERWESSPSGWAWLGTSTPVAGDIDQDWAIQWLQTCFNELEQAKVFSELKNWRRRGRLGEGGTPDDD